MNLVIEIILWALAAGYLYLGCGWADAVLHVQMQTRPRAGMVGVLLRVGLHLLCWPVALFMATRPRSERFARDMKHALGRNR